MGSLAIPTRAGKRSGNRFLNSYSHHRVAMPILAMHFIGGCRFNVKNQNILDSFISYLAAILNGILYIW